MSVEEPAATALPTRLVVWVFGCVLLVSVMLAWTFLAVRGVVAVGGSCASGGAFEIATPCPDGAWLLAPAVPVMILAALSGSGAGSEIGAPDLVTPWWALLFGSLAWTFFEWAVRADGVEPTALVGGVMFAAFAFPALLPARRLVRRSSRRPPTPGRPAAWWWAACYLGLFSVGASVGIATYALIA